MVARELGEAQRLAIEREGDSPGEPGRIAEGGPAPHVEEQGGARPVQPPPQLGDVDALEATGRHARTIAERYGCWLLTATTSPVMYEA